MLDNNQAQIKVKNFIPGVTLKAWTRYKEFYLFRVEWPSEVEKDWDPFVSVDVNTGEVRDFSILPDLETISNLTWNDIE